MELVQKLLGEQFSQLVATLTGKAGFNPDQAKSFLPPAVGQIVGALQSGGFDLGALLGGGGLGQLLGKVDTGALAREAGVDEATARQGVEVLAPAVASAVKEETAGGLFGAAGSLAGKLFK